MSEDRLIGMLLAGSAALAVLVFGILDNRRHKKELRKKGIPTEAESREISRQMQEENKKTKWLSGKLSLTLEQFHQEMNSIKIEDEEVQFAWELVKSATGFSVSPEFALQSLEDLKGEEDNGRSFNEYSTGADLDHWNADRYDFSRVTVYHGGQKAYCSREKLLAAYLTLEEKVRPYFMRHDAEKYPQENNGPVQKALKYWKKKIP